MACLASISASLSLSDCWKEYSMTLPRMMWRSFVWFTGRRCCFCMTLFHVQTYGSPSTMTATPGRTSLYCNMNGYDTQKNDSGKLFSEDYWPQNANSKAKDGQNGYSHQ